MPESDHISPAQFETIETLRSQLMAVITFILGAEPGTIEAIASRINDRVTAADRLVRGNRGRDVAITMTDMRLMFVGTLRILLDELGGDDSSAALLFAAPDLLAACEDMLPLLEHAEACEASADDGYGPKLRSLREKLIRAQKAIAKAKGTTPNA